ncbi:MAG: Nramp family divalent metal transporter [Cyclobacteriaceae bacterium]|nr:Nramp family divalent metal transporter [Cyclobacteriaceae bacterium]
MSILQKTIHSLRSLGPGLITAALVFGPGSLTVGSKLGASFQYQLLWVVVGAALFMIAYTVMAARIGLSSDISLLQYIREKYGKITAALLGVGMFMTTASFQAGNSIGAGVAFAELFNTPVIPWIIFFSGAAIVMLFFKGFYKIFEKVMLLLVGLMLVSFFVTIVVTKPVLTDVLTGFKPAVPPGSERLTIALVASTFSIIGAFYQSYLVREKGWRAGQERTCLRETIAGIIILALITLSVLICAGNVLHAQDIEVKSVADMGRILEPLFGRFTSWLFTFGLFAASFTSLLGNGTIGGSMLADGFGMGSDLKSGKVRGMIMLVIVFGASIAIIFGALPLELIVFAQGLTIIIVPVVAFFILMIANQQLMGKLKNNLTYNVIGAIGLIVLLALAISNVKLIFFS